MVSAADSVFATPELAEMILLHLPTRGLYRIQLDNRSIPNNIVATKSLGRKMWLHYGEDLDSYPVNPHALEIIMAEAKKLGLSTKDYGYIDNNGIYHFVFHGLLKEVVERRMPQPERSIRRSARLNPNSQAMEGRTTKSASTAQIRVSWRQMVFANKPLGIQVRVALRKGNANTHDSTITIPKSGGTLGRLLGEITKELTRLVSPTQVSPEQR